MSEERAQSVRLSRAQVREVDRISIEEFHVPGIVLMENAAIGAFRIINGITLKMPLLKAGRFDLLLGEPGAELFVPLHAILRFEAQAAPEPTTPAS